MECYQHKSKKTSFLGLEKSREKILFKEMSITICNTVLKRIWLGPDSAQNMVKKKVKGSLYRPKAQCAVEE
jgi:hypothetical protein